MNHSSNRRHVLGQLLVASLGGILPSSKLYGRHAQQSRPVRQPRDFEPVRQRILQEIAQETATGVAVAVAHHGRIVWEEGFGWANRESRVKATPHTPFCLASITKPFT